MVGASVLFLLVAMVFLFLAIGNLWVDRAFDRNTAAVGRTTGMQIDVKHKKDVWLWGARRRDVFLKHQSTAKYEYRVNGKTYTVKNMRPVTAKQMPRMVSVMYIKRFPKIACVKDWCTFVCYSLNAILFFGLFVVFFMLGIAVLFL